MCRLKAQSAAPDPGVGYSDQVGVSRKGLFLTVIGQPTGEQQGVCDLHHWTTHADGTAVPMRLQLNSSGGLSNSPRQCLYRLLRRLGHDPAGQLT
jgi:hypothetical protein